MARYRVIANGLNVRKDPSLDGIILGTFQKDDEVELVDKSENGYWYKVNHNNLTGWVSQKYLVNLANDNMIQDEEFPWMPIVIQEIGVKEFPGPPDNPRIVQYLQSTSLEAPERNNDETAWCSAFVNWCIEQAGFAGTDSSWARDWLNWGIQVDSPRRGCIVIFRRTCKGDDPLTRKNCGHVAFFIEETSTHVKVLGGNQGNAVSMAEYSKDDLLGYRLPI